MTLGNAAHAEELTPLGNGEEIVRFAMISKRTLLLLCFCAVLLLVVSAGVKAKLQVFLAPVIFLVFAKISVASQRIPRLVLLCALCGVVLGAIFQFSHISLQRGAFLVATVSEQDLKQESKIYRDRIRRILGASGESLVGLYHGKIDKASDARAVLQRTPSLGGVLWGAERWMTASLRENAPLSLASFPEDSAAQALLRDLSIADLLIATSVPSLGMSHGHQAATVYFLGSIIPLWRAVPEVIAPRSELGDLEGKAYTLARMQARWTSRQHVAFPMWLVGTYHLVRALEKPQVETAELDCAAKILREALMQFYSSDNRALEAAVRNNYALALLVQATSLEHETKLWGRAMKQLSRAARLKPEWGVVSSVVRHNEVVLKSRRVQKRGKHE